MLRTALVGVSGYGRWHLMMAIDQMLLGRIKLVGATIINPESERFICARLRALSVPIFSSFEEMIQALDGRLDLCLIPTGIHHHAPMTIAALRAGANVLVEKPLAATLQDIDLIRAEEERTGRWAAVGFQELYVPETHAIKRAALEGEIGVVQRIVARGQWPRSHLYYQRNQWAGRLRIGEDWILDSPANNAMAHYLTLALFWAGEEPLASAEIQTVQAGLYRAQAIESFDTVSLRATTRAGVVIDFHGTHSGWANTAPEITIHGSAGCIRWVYDHNFTISPSHSAPRHSRLQEALASRMAVGDSIARKCREPDVFVCSTPLARVHTHLINLLHEKFPITDVPPGQLESVMEAGEPFTRIRGIDAAIETAVNEGSLLGGATAPWAVPAPVVAVGTYLRFAGTWVTPGTVPASGPLSRP